MEIENAWVIVHQPGGQGAPVQTVLGGRPGATLAEFSLIAADLIRHIARATGADEIDVLSLVSRELANPTTDISGSRVQ